MNQLELDFVFRLDCLDWLYLSADFTATAVIDWG